MGKINFSQGGYGGDYIEERFSEFTKQNMEFWWFFREILRSSDERSKYWQNQEGTDLDDLSQKELIALSMLHYAVYTGIAEAIVFAHDIETCLKQEPTSMQFFNVKRFWKSAYSNLYTSFNALCNIVYVLATGESVFKSSNNGIWNYTPSDAIKALKHKNLNDLVELLKICNDCLEIRSHLDHYWTIWVSIREHRLYFDSNFEKGYISLQRDDVNSTIDALKRLNDHIAEISKNYNLIYEKISLEKDGIFDKYLNTKNWKIDYSDYGYPHNGMRPQVK